MVANDLTPIRHQEHLQKKKIIKKTSRQTGAWLDKICVQKPEYIDKNDNERAHTFIMIRFELWIKCDGWWRVGTNLAAKEPNQSDTFSKQLSTGFAFMNRYGLR